MSDQPPKKRPGRPRKDESANLRIETVKLLMEKSQEALNEPVELEVEEVVHTLSVSRQTAMKILDEVGAMLTATRRTQSGLALGDRHLYFDQMLGQNRELKKAVARKFADHIMPGTSISCAAGTTVEEALVQLHVRGVFIEVVTNNYGPLECLPRRDVNNVVLTGGSYRPALNACVGDQTVRAFREARCRVALCGVSGINGRGDLFVRHREEVEVLVELLESATESIYVLADVTKLAQEDMWTFANLARLSTNKDGQEREVRLITNPINLLPAALKKAQTVYKALKAMKGFEIILT